MKYITKIIIILLTSILLIGYLVYLINIKGRISSYYISSLEEDVVIDGYLFISNNINILSINKINSDKED